MTTFHACEQCGTEYASQADALRCCDEQFDDDSDGDRPAVTCPDEHGAPMICDGGHRVSGGKVRWYGHCECGRFVSTRAPYKEDGEQRIRCSDCTQIVRVTECTSPTKAMADGGVEVTTADDLGVDPDDEHWASDHYDNPIKLDIGGGRDPEPGHINIDLRDITEADIQTSATDLSMFADGSVRRIHANSLLPHLDDIIEAINEWARVLEVGGELVVDATHSHSTGIYQDVDHNHWSWTSESPAYFDHTHDFAYYTNGYRLRLEEVDLRAWARPGRWWTRPIAWSFGTLVDHVSDEVGDELMKLPFAAGRVKAVYRKEWSQ